MSTKNINLELKVTDNLSGAVDKMIIMQNNGLLADFMKVVFDDDADQYYDSVVGVMIGHRLRYNDDWNWLMEVVEKIESIIFDEDNSYNVTIGSTNYCVIQDSNGEVYDSTHDGGQTKLETVYNAVIAFIKWYNENVKP